MACVSIICELESGYFETLAMHNFLNSKDFGAFNVRCVVRGSQIILEHCCGAPRRIDDLVVPSDRVFATVSALRHAALPG